MYGYEAPGIRGLPVQQAKPNPDYAGQTQCVGYEAVIDGLRYSTLHSDLVCGPETEEERWGYGSDRPMLWRTKKGAFFYLFRGKFQVLGERAARDKFEELRYSQRMTEVEAFGSATEIA